MQVDKEVIQQCIKGDRRAQEKLYKICFQLLMPLCYKYVRQEELARELLNESFVKIIYALKNYNSDLSFKKWAQSITINHLINEYHKQKRLRKIMDENAELENSYVMYAQHDKNTYDTNIENERVSALLNQLPPSSRKVFSLFALEGFSHEEISNMLNISTGTSKWHLSNAREMLKKLVTGTFTFLLFLK
jgi:RNA polymerase sigma factor (sigma-70 family)